MAIRMFVVLSKQLFCAYWLPPPKKKGKIRQIRHAYFFKVGKYFRNVKILK
jgi:hypothetical protein